MILSQEKSLKCVLEDKLHDRLEKAKPVVNTLYQNIIKESANIEDYLVPTDKMQFGINSSRVGVLINEDFMPLTNFSVGQLAAKNKIPTQYLKELAESKDHWKQNLACEIMHEHNKNVRDQVLLRSSDNTIKAYVSSKYKRFKSEMLYETFNDNIKLAGAQIVDGFLSESKIFLEALLPNIIEIPTENNGIVYVAAGTRLKNSDYGDGALELSTFLLNAVCTNGLVTENAFRRTHLGSDISKNISIARDTMITDTKAHCMYMRDVIGQTLSINNIERHAKGIQKASSNIIDIEKEIIKLPKVGILKEEIEEIKNVLIAGRSEDGLYGEPTSWKFINSITAVARDAQEERKRELEALSGRLFQSFVPK